MQNNMAQPENVVLRGDENAVVILDQTLLPNEVKFCTLETQADFYEAIFTLQVRGAPAIGICAGFAMYVLAKQLPQTSGEAFAAAYEQLGDALNAARPTAVNLSWAIDRMRRVVRENSRRTPPQIIELLAQQSKAIQQEDIRMCRAISAHGLSLLQEGDGILTHCNAGPLATSLYGTALGPIFLAKEKGIHLRVFADETRPLLQGARLTTYELSRAGIDVTLICDNMASVVMKNGWINACFVGCDRIAANGDTANKIGTSGVAILAKHYGIPFYVLGPTSTIDLNCKTGAEIKIELRDESEICEKHYSKPMTPAGVKCYNPAFDVTDHTLIAGIVTEHGICRAPYCESLAAVMEK